MTAPDYKYLRNEFDFTANRKSPKGLDFQGLDEIRAMPTKIDITSLRDHFLPCGTMKPVSYQDYLNEHKATLRK